MHNRPRSNAQLRKERRLIFILTVVFILGVLVTWLAEAHWPIEPHPELIPTDPRF